MSMTQAQRKGPYKGRRGIRLIFLLCVLGALGVFVGANAHLLHVAFTTQPECVPHSKTADENGSGYRAAKSAC